jgi:hypothetical protein
VLAAGRTTQPTWPNTLVRPDRAGNARLLSSASWDADEVLEDVRDWVVAHLGEPDAILVIDETGDLKRAAPRSGSSASPPAPREADRELPGRGLPHLRHRQGARADGSGAVPAESLDRERRAPQPGGPIMIADDGHVAASVAALCPTSPATRAAAGSGQMDAYRQVRQAAWLYQFCDPGHSYAESMAQVRSTIFRSQMR